MRRACADEDIQGSVRSKKGLSLVENICVAGQEARREIWTGAWLPYYIPAPSRKLG